MHRTSVLVLDMFRLTKKGSRCDTVLETLKKIASTFKHTHTHTMRQTKNGPRGKLLDEMRPWNEQYIKNATIVAKDNVIAVNRIQGWRLALGTRNFDLPFSLCFSHPDFIFPRISRMNEGSPKLA